MSVRFIKAYSDLMDSAIWQDDGTVKLYLYLLFQSSWRYSQSNKATLVPGELLLTQREAAAELHWSRSKFQDKLASLAASGKITIYRVRHKTLVKINDYEPGISENAGPESVPGTAEGMPENQSKTPATVIVWPDNQPIMDRKSVQLGMKISPKRTENQSKIRDTESVWPENQPIMDQKSVQLGPEISPKRTENQSKSGHACIGVNPIGSSATGMSEKSPKNIDIKNYKSAQAFPDRHEPDGFARLWSEYPAFRRTHRQEAAELYRHAAASGATSEAMLLALSADKRSSDWQKENGQYIPGLVRWLQRESWREYTYPLNGGDEEWTSR